MTSFELKKSIFKTFTENHYSVTAVIKVGEKTFTFWIESNEDGRTYNVADEYSTSSFGRRIWEYADPENFFRRLSKQLFREKATVVVAIYTDDEE